MYQRETLPLYDQTPDLIPQEAPAGMWQTALNVNFKNGETFRAAGQVPVMNFTEGRPLALAFYQDITETPYWVAVTIDGIYVTDGATVFDITPAVWSPTFPASFMAFSWNGIVVVHSSTTDPVYWDGITANVCVPLPDWGVGWRFHALRPFGNFLFAIGQLDGAGSQRVRWSDVAEAGSVPTSWTPTDENFAGFADLAPATGGCFDAAPVRSSLLIFKGETVFTCDLIGGNAVFQFRILFNGTGIIGPNAWCPGPSDQILFASSDGDILTTEGVSWTSILAGKLQRTFYDELNGVPFYGMCAATLGRERLSIIGYPSQDALEGQADLAITYNWEDSSLGRQSLANVSAMAAGRMLTDVGALNEWDTDDEAWNLDPSAWNFEINAATNDDIVMGGADGTLGFGGVLDTQLEAEGINFGGSKQRKLVGRVWPGILGNEGDSVQVRVGGQETVGGPVSWAPPVIYPLGGSGSVDVFVEGRFLALQVTANGGERWKLGSMDVEYQGAGEW